MVLGILQELPFPALHRTSPWGTRVAAGPFTSACCFFPNSYSELKASTCGQKIGPEDTVQRDPATLVLKPGRLIFAAIYMTW